MLKKNHLTLRHAITLATGVNMYENKKWLFAMIDLEQYTIRYHVKELRPDPDYPDQMETCTAKDTGDLDEAIYVYNSL